MKVEIRNPKSERNPNSEFRIPNSAALAAFHPLPEGEGRPARHSAFDEGGGEGERHAQHPKCGPTSNVSQPSDFGFRPSFGFRSSAFGFTLIELLIVIAIMAILAALIFPVTGAINRNKIRSRARAEMSQIATAIESYKAKLGHYPPDNPARADLNQLYYELLGTTNSGPNFVTLDGVTTTLATTIKQDFGADGIVNSTRGSTGDEAGGSARFLKNLKPNQFFALTGGNAPAFPCTILGSDLETTNTFVAGNNQKVNPWNYNSSNPTNNPQSFDLWMDIRIGGRINRICNWSPNPIVY